MDRKHIYLLILIPLIFCIFLTFPPLIGECASVKTTLDVKYTHRESTQTDETDKEDEYNPRLSVKYSHPLTRWTNLSAEAKFDYKEEKNKDPSGEEVTRTKEPQIELSLKSLIYDFKTGFKRTQTQAKPFEDRIFGHLLIQPSVFPEFRVDYDRDETEKELEKDRIVLGAIYKPSKILRIKLDFKYEYSDYFNESTSDDESTPDIEDYNLNGEIKFNHTLSTRCPIKTEISYKAEKLKQEEHPEEQQDKSEVKQREFLHTLRGKLTYKPTKKTNISLEYEHKIKDDQKETAEDKSDKDIQFNISQKFTDWLEVRGWIREESEEEEDPNNIIDTEKRTLNGHIRAVPKKWLQLNLKVIDEDSKESDTEEETDKTTLEASLRSEFPNLLRSHQTLDFKSVKEDKDEKPFSKEEQFMWKWSLSPVENLSLKPEYIHAITNKEKEDTSDTTDEYKLNLGYSFSLNDIWVVDLSHETSRKEIKTESKDPNKPTENRKENRKEKNNDSSLEVDFQPYESLFITSQVTRRHYKISGDKSKEMSYSFKFDWSFIPFTWSTSYKYDYKKQQNDTETFESKILYNLTDYTVEVEYKFTQTFRTPKDTEDIVTLRFKAVF